MRLSITNPWFHLIAIAVSASALAAVADYGTDRDLRGEANQLPPAPRLDLAVEASDPITPDFDLILAEDVYFRANQEALFFRLDDRVPGEGIFFRKPERDPQPICVRAGTRFTILQTIENYKGRGGFAIHGKGLPFGVTVFVKGRRPCLADLVGVFEIVPKPIKYIGGPE